MIDFQQVSAIDPPRELKLYLNHLLRKETEVESERRRAQRFQLAVPVPAIALDEQFQPVGEAFVCMARNISSHGISLVCTSRIEVERLGIELARPGEGKIQLAVEVHYCRTLGRYFETGCSFIRRLRDDASESSPTDEINPLGE